MKRQTLQDKQDEQGRLLKAYRAKQREKWSDALEQEPRLGALRIAIKRCLHPSALVVAMADSWVRCAPIDIRHVALRLVDAHCNAMARAQGGVELDDPLPPQSNVFFAVREILDVR